MTINELRKYKEIRIRTLDDCINNNIIRRVYVDDNTFYTFDKVISDPSFEDDMLDDMGKLYSVTEELIDYSSPEAIHHNCIILGYWWWPLEALILIPKDPLKIKIL